mgnify:CR=1 FL=1
MRSTTVKLSPELLAEIEAAKPEDVTVTAFVQQSVRQVLLQQRLRASAEAYRDWLAEAPDSERALLDAWEAAPLATPPSERG